MISHLSLTASETQAVNTANRNEVLSNKASIGQDVVIISGGDSRPIEAGA